MGARATQQVEDQLNGVGRARRGHRSHRVLVCAEQVRLDYLRRFPDHGAVKLATLHDLARVIAERCGCRLFKAHRLAWGWSVTEAVEAFHVMCCQEGFEPRGLVARSWLEWESGSRPSWDYQDLLSRLFKTNPVRLGWAGDYTPATGPAERRTIADPEPARPAGPPPPADSPATPFPGTGRPVLSQLPPDIGDFVGRSDQAASLEMLFRGVGSRFSDAVKIAVISGKPGVGKSCLALHVAHRVRRYFPDGQMYVDLHGAEGAAVGPAEALAGFLRELSPGKNEIPEDVDDRARTYRAWMADRRILVVLDNAADAAQVRPLLPGTPSCAVLVTSRPMLSTLAGSRSVPLDVMSLREATALLGTIISTERAAPAPEAVAEVAELCGRLPLAVRIAGARLLARPVWGLPYFASRLRDEGQRLDLLSLGDLCVRRSLANSYQNQELAGRRAFRLAGRLRPEFPARDLAALLGTQAGEAEALLEALVDAQLVDIADIDRTGMILYRLDELPAVFARECLVKEENAR